LEGINVDLHHHIVQIRCDGIPKKIRSLFYRVLHEKNAVFCTRCSQPNEMYAPCINSLLPGDDCVLCVDFVIAIMLFRLFLTVQMPFASLLTRGDMVNFGITSRAKVGNRVW